MLVEIWQEVFLIDPVSVFDQFLAIGGNSLLAIRILSRINNRFRLDLPLNSIFKYSTVADFGQYIEETIYALMQDQE